jgi:hypothetical protein
MSEHPEVVQAGMEIMPWEGGVLDFATTLPPTEALKLIDASVPLADVIGKPIALKHLIAHRVSLANPETGEVKDAMRLILVDSKGAAYHCVSEGVLTSLKMITAVLDRKPPFDPPLNVIAVQKQTKGGRRIYKLSLA